MTSIPDQYHLWYYGEQVWTKTTFLGIRCLKSVSDMWNYQEIIAEYKPSLVIEFGTYQGGSALFFAELLNLVSPHSRVLTVDIDQSKVDERVRRNPRIEFLEGDSTSAEVAERVRSLRGLYPGNAFFIVDSDHRMEHVFNEMLQLRSITKPGDYVVIEDGNVNGHPILPDWGPGPYEALEAYFAQYPDDYESDSVRERKFGFTFAPKGFLIRRELAPE